MDTEQRVVVAAGVTVLAAVAFRAWAVLSGYFHLDDYVMLWEASQTSLTFDHLVEPYANQLMPGGRLLVWSVHALVGFSYPAAAVLTIGLTLLAGLAAAWMLLTLFGPRRGVLVPLALYLTSAITLPATMWWAASLNQVPLQIALFVAVTAWVKHLRSGSLLWTGVTVLAVLLGLAFYVKAILIVPVLAFVAVAYFAEGSPGRRIVTVLRREWLAVAVAGVLAGAYVVYYATNVPQPFEEDTPFTLYLETAETMLGTAFLAGAMGGPWRWLENTLPNAPADPPAWSVHLVWVAAAAVLAYAFLRRSRTLRAWLLLLGYLVAELALLVNTRGAAFGSELGLQYRYLTDAACVLALAVGLAFLPVVGAENESSEERREPYLRLSLPPTAVAAVTALVVLSSLVSSARYVEFWDHDNGSETYVRNLQQDLRSVGRIDLADHEVPERVLPWLLRPDNTTRVLAELVSDNVSFPETSAELVAVASDGILRHADIDPRSTSEPGPVPGCGHRVGRKGATVPLDQTVSPWLWWVRIGYLASAASAVTVTTGDTVTDAVVEPGLNTLFVRVDDAAAFDEVALDGLDPGVVVCVDTIEVGDVVAGERFE